MLRVGHEWKRIYNIHNIYIYISIKRKKRHREISLTIYMMIFFLSFCIFHAIHFSLLIQRLRFYWIGLHFDWKCQNRNIRCAEEEKKTYCLPKTIRLGERRKEQNINEKIHTWLDWQNKNNLISRVFVFLRRFSSHYSNSTKFYIRSMSKYTYSVCRTHHSQVYALIRIENFNLDRSRAASVYMYLFLPTIYGSFIIWMFCFVHSFSYDLNFNCFAIVDESPVESLFSSFPLKCSIRHTAPQSFSHLCTGSEWLKVEASITAQLICMHLTQHVMSLKNISLANAWLSGA